MRVAHRCCMRACRHLDRSTERTGTTITQILLEIVVCSRWRSSSLPLVVLSHTHDTTDNDDLMASISDSLAGGSNSGGFPEFQFFSFWRETQNRRGIIISLLPKHHNFHKSFSGRRRGFLRSCCFFSYYTFFFWARAFPVTCVSLLEEELVLLASTFSCGNNVTKTGKWDRISHILNLRARRILQYVLTGQTDTL